MRAEPGAAVGVNQQTDLDAVAGGERKLLEQVDGARVLTSKRLLETREIGPMQIEQWSSNQLGDASTSAGMNPRTVVRVVGRRWP